MSTTRFAISRIITDESIPRIEVEEDSKFELLSYPKEGIIYESTEISDPFNKLVQFNIKLNGETDKELGSSTYSVRSGNCKGCKQCTTPGCRLIYQNNSKRKRCPIHGSELMEQQCQTKFYFAWRGNEQYVYSIGEHSHNHPPQRKIPPSQIAEISTAFTTNSTLTAKDVSLGVGIASIPSIGNRACANISRIQQIKRQALQSSGTTPTLAMMKVEEQMLPSYRKQLSVSNSNVANELLWIRNVSNSLDNTIIHVQFPIFSKVVRDNASFLVIDLKHKSKEGPFYHHLGISSFIEEQKGGFALQLSRTLMEEQTYVEPFLFFLNTLEKDGCNLQSLFVGSERKIKGILVDFSQFQLKGMIDAFTVKFGEQGESIVTELTSGCYVHFLRSAKRLVNSLPLDNNYRELVFGMLERIQDMASEIEIVRIIDCLESLYKGAKSWCDWWRQPRIISLLLAQSSTEHNLPRNTNTQEILNVNVPTFGGNWSVESELLLKHDMVGLIKYLSLSDGIELSYRDTTKKGREQRNKRRNELKYDSRPADTVARGVKQTPVSSIKVIQEFVENVKEMDKNKVIEFAEAEADDLDDIDFIPSQPGSSSDHAKQAPKKKKNGKLMLRSKSKVIEDESSSSSTSSSASSSSGHSKKEVQKRQPKNGIKRPPPVEKDSRKRSKVIEDGSSSSGFDSTGGSSCSSTGSDSDESVTRDSEIFTRSKIQIGNNDRSESNQLKAARKVGVRSTRGKSL